MSAPTPVHLSLSGLRLPVRHSDPPSPTSSPGTRSTIRSSTAASHNHLDTLGCRHPILLRPPDSFTPGSILLPHIAAEMLQYLVLGAALAGTDPMMFDLETLSPAERAAIPVATAGGVSAVVRRALGDNEPCDVELKDVNHPGRDFVSRAGTPPQASRHTPPRRAYVIAVCCCPRPPPADGWFTSARISSRALGHHPRR